MVATDESIQADQSTDVVRRPATTIRATGLVSRRVEMYESPRNASPPKPYRHRQQDSFQAKPVYRQEGKRDLETRQENSPIRNYEQNFEAQQVVSELVESGVDHYNKGEYAEALRDFSTALRNQRSRMGHDNMSIALTLGNLGAVYLQLDMYIDAQRTLMESLEIKKRLAPSSLMADTLNNLGNCANLQGDLQRSLFFYEQALEDLKDKNGEAIDIANALFNIGRLEVQQREWKKALQHLDEACGITRQVYGDNHAFVAQTLDLIGYVHLSTLNHDRAMIAFTGALSIHRQLQGPINIDVANSLLNVGILREAKGELTEAWEAYSTANDIFVRLNTDKDHPTFAAVRSSVVTVERAITKKNQQKLVEKHKKARAFAQLRAKVQTKKV